MRDYLSYNDNLKNLKNKTTDFAVVLFLITFVM